MLTWTTDSHITTQLHSFSLKIVDNYQNQEYEIETCCYSYNSTNHVHAVRLKLGANKRQECELTFIFRMHRTIHKIKASFRTQAGADPAAAPAPAACVHMTNAADLTCVTAVTVTHPPSWTGYLFVLHWKVS